MTHSIIGVSISPGWMQFTRIPKCCHFGGNIARKSFNGKFAGCVVGSAGQHARGLNGTDVDDCAMQLRSDRSTAKDLRTKPAALEIDRRYILPLFVSHFEKRNNRLDTRIVDL